MNTITTLTVRQPWAWAIAAGLKTVENRTWATTHRGPLLIHAGKSRASMGEAGRLPSLPADLPFGVAMCVVDLIDCVPLADVPAGETFAEGPWCWILRNPRAVEPVPIKGRLGLFQVPRRVVID